MASSNLSLVGDRRPPRSRRTAISVAAILLAAAGFASVRDADRDRERRDPVDDAESVQRLAVRHGVRADEVRGAATDLRADLGRRPLDARLRVAYAGLLLSLSGSLSETDAAAFHARRAAELAPVTLPVARRAGLVLAGSAHDDEALAITRRVFGFDPPAGARLLGALSAWMNDETIARGVPDAPEAWVAWAGRLRSVDEASRADAWLDGAGRRWPTHPEVVLRRAEVAIAHRDHAALAAAFAPLTELPDGRRAALLHIHRARARAWNDDAPGALADVRRALARSGSDPGVLVHAGDVYAILDLAPEARAAWARALHRLPPSASLDTRVGLRVRIARLEDRTGDPAAALRAWRTVLSLDPEHAEALGRIAAIGGGRSESAAGRASEAR